MTRITRLGLIVATIPWLLGGLGVGTARAQQPQREPFSAVGHGVVDCGTFEDVFTDFFNGTQTIYFDSAGNPIRFVLNVEHHSDDVNSVTGLVLHEHGHFTLTFDFVTETTTIVGNQEVLTRPGFGLGVQDVGRVIFDANGDLIFFAGGRQRSQLLLGDQLFCEVLA
jgi:hypothetical protein